MLKKFISFATALTLLVCVSMTASAAGGKTAVVNTMDILVDDAAAMPSGYVIEGYTYFKLAFSDGSKFWIKDCFHRTPEI